MINASSKERVWFDIFAVVTLSVLALWLFRFEFQGYLWIGNPDRLNSDLKITQHYLAHSPIQAWNQHEMMGYDSFALPYIYPHFLLPILKWFGISKAYTVMGFIVIGLLMTAGVSAYICVRAFTGASLATLTSAVCYQFSGLTLLKVSQNAMSFSVFIVIPLCIWCLRTLSYSNRANRFLFLSLLLSLMLEFMFLQKSAYAIMLIGSYSVWISRAQKKFYPFLIFSMSLLIAIIFAGPRIFGIWQVMREYSRVIPGMDFKKFDDIYQFQNIRPYEILRWFDANIYGRFPSEAFEIKNNINLTEGFLIYTSSVVPFLLILVGIKQICYFKQIFFRSDFLFFSIIFIGCLLVILWPMMTEGLYLLFFKMDFTHARILIIGLMALAILLAGALAQIKPKVDSNIKKFNQFFMITLSLGLAGLFYWLVELYTFSHGWQPMQMGVKINLQSIHRIQTSLVVVILCLFILSVKFIFPWVKEVIYKGLCFFIMLQCLGTANFTINGLQNFNMNQPFYKGDMYYAHSQEFTKPSQEQIHQLHQRTQPDLYRVALICDKKLANGFCAGHVPEYWGLRAIDGYYGIGVPKRIRALPWTNGIDLRTLSFSEENNIPWKLLGFLNVKSVLMVKNGLYRNITSKHHQIISGSKPSDFDILSSPERVTPRAFFAESVQSVPSLTEAIRVIFKGNDIVSPEKVSAVENFEYLNFPRYKNHEPVRIYGDGDDLFVQFKPAAKQRFLVVNELYFPGWQAEAAGRLLPIYPTNVVMRGVVVPPLVNLVHFHYTSLSTTVWARAVQISALIVLLVCLMYFKRHDKYLLHGSNNDKRL